MKELTIIRNPTPDSAEILVTFLDDNGIPRNVLLRAEHTVDIDHKDDQVVATKALAIFVGEDEIESGKKQLPSFTLKQESNADRTIKDQADHSPT